ncbi:DNA-directed DNA polymerase [Tanacetum coccineum]|uniref:DNA-directed DNA polymerase n=1 Tax=Tanacetum coccineum TaxID=301880 RepID=A0ABQ5DHJ3_9ASTR
MDANSQLFGIRQECPTKSVSEVKTSYDQRLDNLTALVEKLVMCNSTPQVKACRVCSVVGHPTDMCPTLQDGSPEQMNAVGGFPGPPQRKYDPFSSTYNLGWRDHPNFSYGSRKLPSQTVNNPKQNVSAITLRSGKVLEEQPLKPSKRDLEKEIVKEGLTSQTDQPQETIRSQEEIKIPPPFPGRFAKSRKQEQEKEILKTFRKVEVNIPLLDAIKQVPRYVKFLKELCTLKRKLKGNEKVLLGENVSAMIQKKLPIKCKDPCMFTIPCKMGNVEIEREKLDLGASINVMPRSIYEAMNVGKLKETGVIIQLADRFYAYPDGVLEDILVQVKDLVFLADFYVVDMGKDNHSNTPSILLGRPFLKTARTNICVHEGTLAMEFDGQKFYELNDEDSLKVALTNTISESANKEFEPNLNLHEVIFELNSLAPVNKRVSYIGLPLNNAKLLPSIVQAPKLELKKLPDHLMYLFLKEGDTLLVISSNKLTPLEDERLIRVLRDYKEAIGWKVPDISGISPSMCMHKILLEEGATPAKQAQRRLNPPMMEVVKKEIQKLLDAGIIYLILDSKWVSPIQVVPKKIGVNVVENSDGELVTTRVQNGWRICIDYRKLNALTRKDHFPIPFINQMLERLAGRAYYCFLDGYSGFHQISVAPEDQEKTTFTCPFGTFAFCCMPFGLCNAPATFQRCMVSIFSEYVEDIIEVFMDDFTVHGDSFDSCLINLEKILKRCIESNLVLNYEKCQFMVDQGNILGHIVSAKGLKVDKVKIAFEFDDHCKVAFDKLKELLTSSPIIQPPHWNLPFEIMSDASNYAVGAVLGQRVGKSTHVIYYASRTLDSAQSLKYVLAKKEAKPRLIRWILLLQEFNLEIRDKKGSENLVTDHLSRVVIKQKPNS